MKLLNTKVSLALTFGIVLTACDPSTIDPESIGSASAGSGNDSSIGLFQLQSDDFDQGSLTNADITVSGEPRIGAGTANSPLVFGLGSVYTFSWASSISTDSTLTFSLFSPDNPDSETKLAEIECSSSNATTCGSTENMECWFVGSQTTDSYSTSFYCTHEEEGVQSIYSQEAMAKAFLPDWSEEWSDLDLNVGVKLQLCDSQSDSSCDVATLGYLKLTEYTE